MTKEDLRVRKTKAAIHDAFLLLLQKKKVEKISVKELCETAMIGKGTFYLHYTDIYDLYHQEVLHLFSNALDELGDAGLFITDSTRFFQRFGQIVQPKQMERRLLVQGGGDISYIQEFADMICERVFASGALPQTETNEMRLRVIVLSLLYLMLNYDRSFDQTPAAALIQEMIEKLL